VHTHGEEGGNVIGFDDTGGKKHVLHSQIELEYPVRNITDQKDKV